MSPPKICQIGSEIEKETTWEEITPTNETNSQVGFSVGNSSSGNKEKDIWQQSSLGKESTSSIPKCNSNQEAIGSNFISESDEIVMFIAGNRIKLKVVKNN